MCRQEHGSAPYTKHHGRRYKVQNHLRVMRRRQAGIRAEMFLGGGNMAKQLKYADKRGCPVAVIEGGDEKDAGIVQLKDLALGARLAAEIETNEEWKALWVEAGQVYKSQEHNALPRQFMKIPPRVPPYI